MKIGLFDPYMDTLGGGERYILSIASILQESHQVTLFWNDKEIIKKAKEKFLLNLGDVHISKNIFTSSSSLSDRIRKTFGLDYFFYISDGSIPIVASRHVIPIIQFPIENVNGKSLLSRIKFINTPFILCYSEFVKKFLKRQYAVPIKVLYPAVSSSALSLKKENIILSVGRFTQGNNTKNQKMLIDFFKQHSINFKNWKLILAGSYLVEDEEYVKSLKKIVGKAPIEFHTNISFSEISRLYARSKIYWHAAGFNKDVENNPKHAEHFGISVVEAMSAGSVPIVYNGGGLKEIVQENENGFVFETEKELFDRTKLLMTDNWKLESFSEAAKKRAESFSMNEFSRKLTEIILHP